MVNPLQQLERGIARVESGGDYNAIGPDVKRRRGVDNAYGKYQVMGANVPGWTEQALGRRLTPQEFLRSPEAQEAVFRDQMTRNLQKYGTLEDAASVWFTGRPYAQALKAGARDVNMGVERYVRQAVGGGGMPQGALAYTDGPERPQFPSLKGGVQEAPQELSPEDFFEGRHLSQEAPAPASELSPEDFFEGRHIQQGAGNAAPSIEVKAPGGGGEGAPAAPAAEWGPARAFTRGALSGLTGFIPSTTIAGRPIGPADLSKAGATVQAGYEALTGGAPEGFMARRRELTEQSEQARRAYEQENPMHAGIATGLGAAVGTALPLGLAGKALGAGAKAAGAAQPMIRPALEAAGKFLGGEGSALWGLPSKAASGATYGLGETALTQQLVPEEDRGAYGTGAMTGAAANALLGTLGKPISKIFKAELNENLTPLAKAANRRFDLGIRAGQVAKDAEINKLDEMLVPQHVHDRQVQKFSEAVANEIELKGKPLTDTNINKKMRDIGQELSATVSTRPIARNTPAYGQLVRDVNNIFNGVAGRLNPGDPEVAVINNFLKGVRTAFASGQMDGPVLQNYIAHNGRIANAFRNKGSAALQGVDHDLREAFLNAFEKAHPTVGPRFKEARQVYKKLAAIDTIVGGSETGVINPQALLAQVRKRNISGPLKQLARIGEKMPGVTQTGAARVRGPSGLYRDATTMAAAAAPIADFLGLGQSFGQLASKAVTGQLLTEALQAQALKSPLVNRMKFYAPQAAGEFGQTTGNVLTGIPTAIGAGVGGMERER